jgi:uncharacterized membrane protein
VIEKTVTLQPGESKEVVFEVIVDEAGFYEVSVDGLRGQLTVVEPVANIKVENLNIEPPQVVAGEKTQVSVTVTNYGDGAGEKVVQCEVNPPFAPS